MGQQDSLYPILLYTSFCKYTSLTHNLLPSLRTKTKPWARRTPPEPGSGRSLRSRAGVGSWPLRKCVHPTGLPLKEAKDQAAAGGTEDASHGEAPHAVRPPRGGTRWRVGLTGHRGHSALQQDRPEQLPTMQDGRVPQWGLQACTERGRGLGSPGKQQEPELETSFLETEQCPMDRAAFLPDSQTPG